LHEGVCRRAALLLATRVRLCRSVACTILSQTSGYGGGLAVHLLQEARVCLRARVSHSWTARTQRRTQAGYADTFTAAVLRPGHVIGTPLVCGACSLYLHAVTWPPAPLACHAVRVPARGLAPRAPRMHRCSRHCPAWSTLRGLRADSCKTLSPLRPSRCGDSVLQRKLHVKLYEKHGAGGGVAQASWRPCLSAQP
jgi:hypothetical protein